MFRQLTTHLGKISYPTRRIAVIILVQKAVLALFLFLTPILAPSLYSSAKAVRGRFTVVDTQFYVQIARYGYSPKGRECAFYPLWPFCLRLGSFVAWGNLVVTGYILANLFSSMGLVIFHRLVSEKYEIALANRATILLLLFPGSIFFFFPYTESLFLLLLMLFILALRRRNFWGLAATGFFLPLTRPIGIFILPVLLLEMWRKNYPAKMFLLCLFPFCGHVLYFAIMYCFTGNAFAGFEAQREFPAQPSIMRMADPLGFVEHFARFNWSHDMLYSAVDRALFVAFLLSLGWTWRQGGTSYFYAILNGLIPAVTNNLMSYTRFLSLVFPFFIASGQLFARRPLFWIVASIAALIQLYCLLRHLSGQWVG